MSKLLYTLIFLLSCSQLYSCNMNYEEGVKSSKRGKRYYATKNY